MVNETGWDIMSGTAVEGKAEIREDVPKEIIISSSGMNKIQFDGCICLFSTGLELKGWNKVFSGMNIHGNFEARFKLENGD